jgi:tRNA (mo5U34)-methyltransferase
MSDHDRLTEALGQPWYHTLELAPGAVTRGAVDLRPTVDRVLPESLAGLRCLDVGTFDGFWAFEMERRGAAEVVASDVASFDALDWSRPAWARRAGEAAGHGPGERFGLAAGLLGSRVRRVECRMDELSAERLGGAVDLALVGDVLLHLRDPVSGLEAIHDVLAPGGRVILVEQLNLPLTLLRPRTAWASFQARATDFNWWEGNLRCLEDWLALAGFARPRRRRFFRVRAADRLQRRWHVVLEAALGG